jgi:hypothetical protein
MEEKYNFEGVYTRKGNLFYHSNGMKMTIAAAKNFSCSTGYCGQKKEILLYRTNENPYGSVFGVIAPVNAGVYKAKRGDVEYLITQEENCLTIKIEAQPEPKQQLTPLQIILFNGIQKLVKMNEPYELIEKKLLEGLDKSNRSKHKAKIKEMYNKVVSK